MSRIFKISLLCLLGFFFQIFGVSAQQTVRPLTNKEIAKIKSTILPDGDKVKTYLFPEFKQIKPGEHMKVAILFEIEPGMNIYGPKKSAVNLPTELNWKLPAGITLQQVNWQETIELEHKKNGYVDHCLVIATLKVAKDYQSPSINIELYTNYQMCDDIYCKNASNKNTLSLLCHTKSAYSSFKKIFLNR